MKKLLGGLYRQYRDNRIGSQSNEWLFEASVSQNQQQKEALLWMFIGIAWKNRHPAKAVTGTFYLPPEALTCFLNLYQQISQENKYLLRTKL
jgi:hypothetical protein